MAVLTKIETPVGTVIASSDGQSLTGLWFEGQNTNAPLWKTNMGRFVAVVEECENGAGRLFPRRGGCRFDQYRLHL